MKISIISPTVYAGSTIEDGSYTLSDLVTGSGGASRPVQISTGLEVQNGTDVFEYNGTTFTPPTYIPSDSYVVGDIVFDGGVLKKVVASSSETVPKEPEDYANHETDMNFSQWTQRYFKMPNTHITNKTMGSLGHYNSRWYYIFFEDRAHHPNCGYRISAKDENRLDAENRDSTWYLRSCLGGSTTYSFNINTDFKAVISNWGAPKVAPLLTINFKNLIIRGNYAYLRTHLDLPIEYTTLVGDYTLSEIESPMDIKGFVVKRKINALSVFDKKNYTKIEAYPESKQVSFHFYNTENFDAIALSRVIAETVDIRVLNTDGDSVFELKDYPIYNNLSDASSEQPVTSILYTPNVVTSECLIEVSLNGSFISLGDISVGNTLDMGYTNLTFSNNYRSFSPLEEDQWGNISFKDGIRVKRYYGTVDLETKNYDMIYRTMDAIGGREVIINGSDSINNTPTNSISIFQATMMVGRFKDIKIATSSRQNNKIDHVSTYTFEIHERV